MYKLPSTDIITMVTVIDSLHTLKPDMASGLTNETTGVLLMSTFLVSKDINSQLYKTHNYYYGKNLNSTKYKYSANIKHLPNIN